MNDYLNASIVNSFFLTPVNDKEVESLIKEINNSKSSDHLPQFSVIPNMFANISGNKFNIYERDWSKFDQENFILDYFSVDWEDLLKTDELNADNST